jgi:hypothetical protein
MELLNYVKYIQDEMLKINRFWSGLQPAYESWMQIIEPWTLEEDV